MNLAMPTAGTFRLKGRSILNLGRGIENAHQLSMRSGVSNITIYRIVNKPGEVQSVVLEVLAAVLIDGLGMTPTEVGELKLKDLFDYVPRDQERMAR